MLRRNAIRQKELTASGGYRLLPSHTQRAVNSLLTVGSRCFGKLDDQLFRTHLDSRDVSSDEAPVVDLLG
jgi:hypothetical protein